MRDIFLKKILNKEFSDLTTEELKLIIKYDSIFSLNKKDKIILGKIVENNTLDVSKDRVDEMLKEKLPNSFMILSTLDKYEISEDRIEISFRKSLFDNLNKMNNLQICIFIDKILAFGKEEGLSFFRNVDYSLHEINRVVSNAFGLTLVFEIFKPGKYKTFKAIDYNRIDKKQMIETLDSQVVRYLYILEIISQVVLDTDEDKIFGTKINKIIKEQTAEYIKIINKEKNVLKATGMSKKRTWTYKLDNLNNITIEEDE